MPSLSRLDDLAARATTARNVSIYTAILTGLPLAYLFRTASGYGPGSFLLLLGVAVGVPTALDQREGVLDADGSVIARTLALEGAVGALFSALYFAGTAVLSLPLFQVAVVAFVVAYLFPLAVLDGLA